MGGVFRKVAIEIKLESNNKYASETLASAHNFLYFN